MNRIRVSVLTLFLVLIGTPSHAYELAQSPTILKLEKAVENGKRGASEKFWAEIEKNGTPLIETMPGDPHSMLVTFLWRDENNDAYNDVSLLSEFYDYNREDRIKLSRIPDTNIWHTTVKLPSDSRATYWLAWPKGRLKDPTSLPVSVAGGAQMEAFQDPLSRATHPYTYLDRTVEISWFEGPDAPPELWLKDLGNAPGTTATFEFSSAILGNTREVTIYLPPGYDPEGPAYPFLLLFDREAYLNAVPTPLILDNLIAAGKIPPMIAVLLGNAEGRRGTELPVNRMFSNFVGGELLTYLMSKYNMSSDARGNVVAGSSYGGLAATWIAYNHSDVFGNVISQSGSYWWSPENAGAYNPGEEKFILSTGHLPQMFVRGEKLPLRFYMEVGLWEGSGMIGPNRNFRNILEAKGYEVRYTEFCGGHSYVNWRRTLADGLISLVGERSRD